MPAVARCISSWEVFTPISHRTSRVSATDFLHPLAHLFRSRGGFDPQPGTRSRQQTGGIEHHGIDLPDLPLSAAGEEAQEIFLARSFDALLGQ